MLTIDEIETSQDSDFLYRVSDLPDDQLLAFQADPSLFAPMLPPLVPPAAGRDIVDQVLDRRRRDQSVAFRNALRALPLEHMEGLRADPEALAGMVPPLLDREDARSILDVEAEAARSREENRRNRNLLFPAPDPVPAVETVGPSPVPRVDASPLTVMSRWWASLWR